METLDNKKRVILAVAISFIFLLVYDSYFLSKNRQISQAPSANATQTDPNPAPSVNTQSNTNVKAPVKTPTNAPISKHTIIATVKLKDAVLEISNKGVIATAKFNEKGRKEPISLFSSQNVKPLELRFLDADINKKAFDTNYTANKAEIDATNTAQTIILSQDLNGLIVTKQITFYPSGNYALKVSTDKEAEFFVTPGFRPDKEVDAMSVHGALVLEADETIEVIADGDAKGNEQFMASLVSSFDRYYATLFFDFKNTFEVFITKVNDDEPLSFVLSKNSNLELNGFLGPKNVRLLKSIDPKLDAAVEYGIFTFMAKPLFVFLDLIHSYVNNWGWAILVFILVVKIVLYPLSHKGMVSMGKLKDLAPKIKEIQTKYKGEPQKMQMHMMDLYKKHGANPMGGCLPIIIQIPIFFAIYRVLINAIELRGAQWLYISDLSAMDPYYILPVLMGLSMFLQQKMTPSSFTDPMQEKIMKFLPLVFTIFFFTFPAGLVLYWFANNVLSIIQQYFVNKTMKKIKEK